ncbi:MAG: FAD-dependent oxidoreductase [Candidatus Bipolaricaulota bacterium]
MGKKIGVFLCRCGGNISDVIDIPELEEFASDLDGVAHTRVHENICSQQGQNVITEEIDEQGLDGAVIGACSPHFHEEEFRTAVGKSHLSPYQLEIANLREQNSWVHYDDHRQALEKAKSEIAGKVEKVKRNDSLEELRASIGNSALVIGAGIAGIQAALDLADEGFEVYVVEKRPDIGGRMGRLGRTFPTLDCAPCILDPKMSDLMTHENITVFTYTDIDDVRGSVTNYDVDITINPRYVTDRCTACGDCTDVCPVEVENEFDYGLGTRTAIYSTHEEAVPETYLIDMDNCIQPSSEHPPGSLCVESCPVDAIDFSQTEEHRTLNVDTIVVATGFDIYDLSKVGQYNYEESDNIIHAGQLERMMTGTGPTQGNIVRPADGRTPENVAWVLCAGSRDKDHNEYCSQICCMYSMKQARLLRNMLGPGTRLSIFFTDIRAAGKGFEEFYNDTQNSNIEFIRGRPSSVEPTKEDRVRIKAVDTTLNEQLEYDYDLVVLAPAIVPSEGTKEIAKLLKLPKSNDGFLKESHPKFKPVDTQAKGVFIAGAAQGPKDIPSSVLQGGAAASRVSNLIGVDEVKLDPVIAEIDESTCDGCEGLQAPQCIDNCPFNAVEMGANGKATVNSLLCKGCGLCLSSCPRSAISVKNFRSDQVLSEVKGLLDNAPEPRLLAFLDSNCSYVALDMLSNRRQLYSSNILPVEIPDGAMVTPEWIVYALEQGAQGVFVGTCEGGSDPFSPECATTTEENVKIAKQRLSGMNINPERVGLKLAVTGAPGPVLKELEALNDQIIEIEREEAGVGSTAT